MYLLHVTYIHVFVIGIQSKVIYLSYCSHSSRRDWIYIIIVIIAINVVAYNININKNTGISTMVTEFNRKSYKMQHD